MARRVRDTNLDTRNARRALKICTKPYWRALNKGLHLGYRKGTKGGTWIARRLTEAGRYEEARIGLADDFQDADDNKTLSFNQAQEAARAWCSKAERIESGQEEAHKGVYTVSDVIEDYMKHYKNVGKGIQETEARINAHIAPALGYLDVIKLSPKRITEWHHALATAPARLRTGKAAEKQNTRKQSKDADAIRGRRATANRTLTVLKAALNFGWKQGRIPTDAGWRRVTPFKNVDAPVIRYLTEAESLRLINACPHDLRQIVQGALFTGCRYGELGSLTARDYNPDAGTVAVRISKSGKPRHAVLNDEGKRFFESVTLGKKGSDLIFTRGEGNAWGKSHQSRPLAEACKHAEIAPAISFHILRHTHGSFLAMRGVPMPVIAQQLGHKDTRMTEKHYAHLSPSYVADTIRQNLPTLGVTEEKTIVRMEKRGKS